MGMQANYNLGRLNRCYQRKKPKYFQNDKKTSSSCTYVLKDQQICTKRNELLTLPFFD